MRVMTSINIHPKVPKFDSWCKKDFILTVFIDRLWNYVLVFNHEISWNKNYARVFLSVQAVEENLLDFQANLPLGIAPEQHLISPFKSRSTHLWVFGPITGSTGDAGVPVIPLHSPWKERSHRLSRFRLTPTSFGGFKKKKRTSNVALTVKNALGQWADAGFKISRAGGGLSPAKEDVIIRGTRIVMLMRG